MEVAETLPAASIMGATTPDIQVLYPWEKPNVYESLCAGTAG